MKYTREQAEEVLKDWNEFDKNKRGLSILNHAFLDNATEQPKTEQLEEQLNKSFDDVLYEQELKRTIKKAEKIADKLEKLLSSSSS